MSLTCSGVSAVVPRRRNHMLQMLLACSLMKMVMSGVKNALTPRDNTVTRMRRLDQMWRGQRQPSNSQ